MRVDNNDYEQLAKDYLLVEKAIRFLDNNFDQQPNLSEVAANVGLSEYHFQRLFSRWVGVSPKRFLQFVTKEHAKQMLEKAENLLDVTYQTGLSSSGRLHDLFITCEAVTPGEYRNRGLDLEITYGFHATPFGESLIAITERGICSLMFIAENERSNAEIELRQHWCKAYLREDPEQTQPLLDSIFLGFETRELAPLHLYLNGTNFQIKVWEALIRIPAGHVVTYSDIAHHIGMPKAARAVGSAVGKNPISVIIPCHRVIRKMGLFGNYRWGVSRKKAILGWEMAQSAA